MRKMDEIGQSINLKVVKRACFYTVLFLFSWCIYDFSAAVLLVP